MLRRHDDVAISWSVMARLSRSALILVASVALLLGSTSVAHAATSRFTFTLTLRGTVRLDVGFELSLAPGVGGSNVFCVAQGGPADADVPLCLSGQTYTTFVDLAPGESIEYSLNLIHPRSATTLWSGTLTGDGRNHRRSYVFDFDLPATDALALPSLPTADSPARPPAAPLPALVLVWILGWSAWFAVARRRGASAPS
jgi:hypothetical protein